MKRALFILLIMCAAASASARIATDFFLAKCDMAFKTLSLKHRTELVKYYEAHLTAKTAGKAGAQSTQLLEADDEHLVVETSSVSTDAMYVMPIGKRDTMLVVIHTVQLPAHDSAVEFYNTEWRRFVSPKLFVEPTIDDWIVPGAPENLVTLLKQSALFVPTTYSLVKSTNEKGKTEYTLQATHNLSEFLDKQTFGRVKEILRPSISWRHKSSRWQKITDKK